MIRTLSLVSGSPQEESALIPPLKQARKGTLVGRPSEELPLGTKMSRLPQAGLREAGQHYDLPLQLRKLVKTSALLF